MSFVLLGEPATGKSSLLVALYGALVNNAADPLRLIRTVDEVEFLSRGLEALGRQESVPRTDVDGTARLLVEVARGLDTAILEVPDNSGELLKQTLDGRVWHPDLRDGIRVAAGAMLFLRADEHDPGETTEEMAALLSPGVDDEPARDDGDPTPWAPAAMPSDVRTIDLLQAMRDERADGAPCAIVISAWDRVAEPTPTPAAWLAENMPLLDQYLSCHAERLPHTVFGVSAQGGDFAVGLAAELVGEDPWDRAFVVGPDGAQATLADPVLWLLDASS